MNAFWTPEASRMPDLSLVTQAALLLVVLLLIYTSVRYYQSPVYRASFKLLQVLQLIMLYSWYAIFAFPLSESLPFSHCRIAMFALLLLPDSSPYKRYFALIGVGGAICAFIHPVFDPYPFPHLTVFSFVLGHYALLVNALVYLMRHQVENFLGLGKILLYTFAMNVGIFAVNQLTGGNYGFLREAPILNSHDQLFNYFFVSVVLVALAGLVQVAFQLGFEKRRKESRA